MAPLDRHFRVWYTLSTLMQQLFTIPQHGLITQGWKYLVYTLLHLGYVFFLMLSTYASYVLSRFPLQFFPTYKTLIMD